jgi:hypothetical protein
VRRFTAAAGGIAKQGSDPDLRDPPKPLTPVIPFPALRAHRARQRLSAVVGAPFAGLVGTSTPPPVSIVSDGRGINLQTAAKAASPQNGADRGLDDAQLDGNLLLRPALFAQRLDLGDQALVDNLGSRNRKASRPAPFRCVNCNRLVVSRGSFSIVTRQAGEASKSRRIHFLRCLRQIGKGGERQDRP